MWPFSLKANKPDRSTYDEPKFCAALRPTSNQCEFVALSQQVPEQEFQNTPQLMGWYTLLNYLNPLEKVVLSGQFQLEPFGLKILCPSDTTFYASLKSALLRKKV
tara:strand:+ start:171 stop:485 length:315 start_codon:yes stop_codon:yes gene_type:complete